MGWGKHAQATEKVFIRRPQPKPSPPPQRPSPPAHLVNLGIELLVHNVLRHRGALDELLQDLPAVVAVHQPRAREAGLKILLGERVVERLLVVVKPKMGKERRRDICIQGGGTGFICYIPTAASKANNAGLRVGIIDRPSQARVASTVVWGNGHRFLSCQVST